MSHPVLQLAWLARLVFVALALVPAGTSPGAEPADEFFATQIAPLLQRRCYHCHNNHRAEGGFSWQTAERAFADGYLVPGDAAASHVIQLVAPATGSPRMPKEADPLTSEEVDLLTKWIDAGAHWPEGHELTEPVVTSFDWWSYRPLARPDIPAHTSDWIRTPIDAFIQAEHRARGLTHAPEADRRTLIRRLSYDLTGLPPTPDEVAAFIADSRPDAYERLVDRLLASPHYGERWGRHWLDVVKYADTCGYDKDKLRPNAWPYRDYVIRSFNTDKPYSQFAQEQVAGDVLYPDTEDGIVALGFLAAGPWDFLGHVELPETKIDGMVAKNLDRDDIVASVMNTFTSTTVQCARCHHHKFDPITQAHYYGLQAVFASVDRADRPYGTEGKLVYAAATDFPPQMNFQPTKGKPRAVHILSRGEVTQPLESATPGTIPLAAGDTAEFAQTDNQGQDNEGQRRAALARWLTQRDNPLVWRSIANRIWLYHFGEGLVATPNDFGRMGALPTHPELLDWLAIEFRDGGESMKSLHRLIVISSVYRQAATHNDANDASDAGNQYLWRMNRRRLEAEEIRDTILAASGQLDTRMGGPGYYLFQLEKEEHSPHYVYHSFEHRDPASYRRSVYQFVVRSQPNPWMSVLDCADSSQSTPQRDETLTSLQALAMLNNQFTLVMAEHFASRLRGEADNLPDQIDRATQLLVQRAPTDDERAAMIAYAQEHGLENLCRLLFNLSEMVFVD